MKEPQLEKILEFERRVEALSQDFSTKVEELRGWFLEQNLSILEMELLDCEDDWDILGVLEDSAVETTAGTAEEYGEEEYFALLEKYEAILEEKRKEHRH